MSRQSSPGIGPPERSAGRAPIVQTTFTSEQLAQPEIAEADGILKTCVHYGFCTATCPTYVLFRDENIRRAAASTSSAPCWKRAARRTAKTVHHLDRCLSCLSCVTTCAVKVDYAHLIDIGRSYIEDNYRRPVGERAAAADDRGVASVPAPLRASAAAGEAGAASRRSPAAATCATWSSWHPASGRRLSSCVRASFRPTAMRRMRVALLAGCAQQTLDRNINAGNDPAVAAATAATSSSRRARDAAERCRCTWDAASMAGARPRQHRRAGAGSCATGLDAIVINASGCGTTVKDYGHLVGGDAARRIGALDARRHRTALGHRHARRRGQAVSRRLSRRLLAAARPAS